MTSQLRKAIIKKSRLKNKANKNGKPADKTQRNFVIKLNKEAKESFLKNQITQNATNKTKFFGNYANLFSPKKVFIIDRNLLLRLKEV